jgi:hypothetical protein
MPHALAPSPTSPRFTVCPPSTGTDLGKADISLQRRLEWFGEPSLYLDPAAKGSYFAILSGGGDTKNKLQHCSRVGSLMSILDDVDYAHDTWISQAEFTSANRQLKNFKQVRLCWVDVDTYKVPELQHKSPDQLLSVLLKTCEETGLPNPSLVVFSGRGLQVKWLLDRPIQKSNLSLWNCLQRELCHRLREIGGDSKSCDGSRVLRLVGTINSTSGAMVTLIYSPLHTFCFEALATSILGTLHFEAPAAAAPLCAQKTPVQGDLALHVVADGADRSTAGKPHGHLVSAASVGNLRPFLASQLARDRLQDLDKLAALRGYLEGAPDGMRDAFVFLGATFLAQAFVHPSVWALEVEALAAKFAPKWGREKVRQCTSAIFERMRGFSAGERSEFQGRSFDPRYTFHNSTLLDWLEITPSEETEMTTIIGKPEKARRAKLHKRHVRRATGSVERIAYLAQVGDMAVQKRATARSLKQQGRSWAEVASVVGYKNAATARVACSG